MLPKLQLSYGSNGVSPQGLLASITLLLIGLYCWIVSKNIKPGSPVRQAYSTNRLNKSLAFTVLMISPFLGLINSQSLFSFTAFIKLSVIPTEMLKLVSLFSSTLALTNLTMSGWLQFNMPILAPRLIPPCITISVVWSNNSINETGPDATPFVLLTASPCGLKCEKLNPVPPPDLWISAVFFNVVNIPSILSSIGKTKQADNCPSSLPAFIRVGELGRKSKASITL